MTRSKARKRFSCAVVVLMCGSRFGKSALSAARSVPPLLGCAATAGFAASVTTAAAGGAEVGGAAGPGVAAGGCGVGACGVGAQAAARATPAVDPNRRNAKRREMIEGGVIALLPLSNCGGYRMRMSRVQAVLDQLVTDESEVGVQVAAYLSGRLVIDAWAGSADPGSHRAVDGDTLFNVSSCGKGVAA